MYKAHRIVIFVVVVLSIVLLPLLLNVGRAAAEPTIALATPEIEELSEYQCIESTDYMRTQHMNLLIDWRSEVIRDGKTIYTSSTGQLYEMSLEDTCFGCHSNRAEFCLSCHDYMGVSTDCWNCHDGGESGG